MFRYYTVCLFVRLLFVRLYVCLLIAAYRSMLLRNIII